MASSRAGAMFASDGAPLDPGSRDSPDLPPLSALFLINFDVKAGYTIVWKQCVPNIELEGVVEYKSLPSGLHTVHDDLIYFVHEGHAGLSAFVNEPCEDQELRHARMISVGVLVPLSHGRLGRAWRHAESLRGMAELLARDRKQTSVLESYWMQNQGAEANLPASQQQPLPRPPPLPSPTLPCTPVAARSSGRNRPAPNGGPHMGPGPRLSSFHPAWSLTALLDMFGPLIFPIHRAALLRKRILISCHAPVHQICDFVYNISILSNIPLSVSNHLPTTAPIQRLRPLFAIGVHDIPFLQANYAASSKPNPQQPAGLDVPGEEPAEGWIACTTDSILAMKDTLWDMLITMPATQSTQTTSAGARLWPQVECPAGMVVRATQRDLRRFRTLQLGLSRMADEHPPRPITPRTPTSLYNITSEANWEAVGVSPEAAEKIVEPTTWTALAYNGFMWWASAGEQARSEQADEASYENALLTDLIWSHTGPEPQPSAGSRTAPSASSSDLTAPSVAKILELSAGENLSATHGSTGSHSSATVSKPNRDDSAHGGGGGEEPAAKELAIIAYFHRLTSSILHVLASLNEAAVVDATLADDLSEEFTGNGEGDGLLPHNTTGDDEQFRDDDMRIKVNSQAMKEMGLDVWSSGDETFVCQMVRRYFGQEAQVEGEGVEVCGLRIC